MNKVVLTGADGGIGKSINKVLSAAGFRVYPADLPVWDVTDLKSVKALFEFTGNIRALINCAGISILESLDKISYENWQKHIDVNLNGPFYCMKEALPYLNGGDIINMVSRAGFNFHPNHASYCASKAGLYALSEIAAMDLRNQNKDIRVTSIMPGPVRTGFAGQPKKEWQIDPDNVAKVILNVINLPRNVSIGRIELKPTFPGTM